jgi:hypothetical protein
MFFIKIYYIIYLSEILIDSNLLFVCQSAILNYYLSILTVKNVLIVFIRVLDSANFKNKLMEVMVYF